MWVLVNPPKWWCSTCRIRHPVPFGEADTSDVTAIDVAGNYAFVAEGAAGMEVVGT